MQDVLGVRGHGGSGRGGVTAVAVGGGAGGGTRASTITNTIASVVIAKNLS